MKTTFIIKLKSVPMNTTMIPVEQKKTLWVGDLKDWIDDNIFQLLFTEVAHQVRPVF